MLFEMRCSQGFQICLMFTTILIKALISVSIPTQQESIRLAVVSLISIDSCLFLRFVFLTQVNDITRFFLINVVEVEIDNSFGIVC